MSASTDLNAAQRRAIAALLMGATHDEAATSARKSIRTVRRWLAEDDRFRSELADQSREIMRGAIERLQQGSDLAAAGLVAMAAGEIQPTSARVAACAKVLELARDHGEIDELRQLVDELAVAVVAKKGGLQ